MNAKRPRRLDLNAPLLSTRRSTTTTTTTTTTSSSIGISCTSSLVGSCDRVSFSWEQSPGKPKDTVRRGETEDKSWPLPKPPTIRWQEESIAPHDDGCDGDVDDDNEDVSDNDNCFSDVIDLFSLAGSLNTSEKLETQEDVDFESDIGGNIGPSSPNFMIQRFLPAATALAASSLSALAARQDLSTSNKHIISAYPSCNISTSNNYCNEGACVPRVAGQAYSSSKGCGLVMLFPWRSKHRLCGVKSPVRRARSSFKPQVGPRSK